MTTLAEDCGLWAGIDVAPGRTGREVSEALMRRGVLCKETHGTTLRIAPPLVISEDDLDRGVDAIAEVVGAH
jgi:ornithine--oxo-acid transaminase